MVRPMICTTGGLCACSKKRFDGDASHIFIMERPANSSAQLLLSLGPNIGVSACVLPLSLLALSACAFVLVSSSP